MIYEEWGIRRDYGAHGLMRVTTFEGDKTTIRHCHGVRSRG